MNTPKQEPDAFDTLFDTYFEELMAMSDEEVLDGADPAIVQKEGLAMLENAIAEAGKRRLARARSQLDMQNDHQSEIAKPVVSAQAARDFLKKASNDGRYTLAARSLAEMSDEDVLGLYEQLKRLENGDGASKAEAE